MHFVKIFCVAFLGLINCFVYSVEQQVDELKNAIQNKNFQVITLTRPYNNNGPLLPRKIDRLFKDIQEIFTNFQEEDFTLLIKQFDCKIYNSDIAVQFNNVIHDSEAQINAAKIAGFYKTIKQNIQATSATDFHNKMNRNANASTKTPANTSDTKKLDSSYFTILVMQEGFFSKTHALDNDYVEMAIDFCKRITLKNEKLIIVANFLHEFSKGSALSYLKDYDPPQYIKDIWNGTPIIPDNRLSNYSLVFYSGEIIALYRKGFYAEEHDILIKHGYAYEFGNFKTQKSLPNVTNEHINKIREVINILQQVSFASNNQKARTIAQAKNTLENIPNGIAPSINKAKDILTRQKTHTKKAKLAIKELNSLTKCSLTYDTLFSDTNPLIRIFICADLNLPGIQLFSSIKNDNSFLKSKLYIIQSNRYRLSSTQLPNYCANGMNQILSNGSTIIHADPAHGPFVGYKYSPWRFWKNKEIKAFFPSNINIINDMEGTRQILFSTYPSTNADGERVHSGAVARHFEFTGNEYIINEWTTINNNRTITLFNWI